MVPDWVMVKAEAVVWLEPDKAIFNPTPVVSAELVKSTAVEVVLAVSKTIVPWL